VADKVFRDPLYNYIALNRKRDGWLIDLLNCPEVQRLRRVHQLGVSNYTYSGADHSRLSHSLGVVHLMQLVLEHLERTSDAEKIKASRQAMLATALLHDVGHGPFSHLFEPCLGIDHEAWSVAVIRSSETSVNKVMQKESAYLAPHVADLIDSADTKHPAWQKALMSSQLDVDRLDYLRRDSLFTGAGYGHFDWYRLLTSVEFLGDDLDLVWPEKSALAIEEYIFARYYMYQNVYLHKTPRGFEQLLQAMWNRADALRRDGKDVSAVPALEAFWKVEKPTPESLSIAAYLRLEEFTVLEQIQRWVENPDKSLADCARRFLNRDGLAMVDPPPPVNPLTNDYGDWDVRLKELIEKAGFEQPDMYCLSDTLRGKYRQPYREEPEPENQTAINSIRVRLVSGGAIGIAAHLPRLAAVTKSPGDQVRYYVPKEIRNEAVTLSKSIAQETTTA
jgi:uncharacterized protein